MPVQSTVNTRGFLECIPRYCTSKRQKSNSGLLGTGQSAGNHQRNFRTSLTAVLLTDWKLDSCATTPRDAEMIQFGIWIWMCVVFLKQIPAPAPSSTEKPRQAAMEEAMDNVTNSCFKKKPERNIFISLRNLEKIMQDINFLNEKLTIVHGDIQALIFRIKPTEFKGLNISSEKLMQWHNLSMKGRTQHSMHFPSALLQAAKGASEEMRLICIYLKRSCLFQDGKNSSLLNDDILGATLGNTRVSNLSVPVEMRFWHNYSLDDFNMTCVFWKEGTEAGSQGNWSTEGCNTTTQEGMVLCQCNHFTYFAILLQHSPIVVDEALLAPLTYLTIIGCSLSASACLITIILYVFSSCRKKLHDSTSMIHMNLLGALFFLNVSFLASEPQASNSWWLCKVAAIFLHYSLLCTLTWMGIEGFHLYLLIIRVYHSYISRYLLKLCSVGWGLPGLAVVITLLIRNDVYGILEVRSTSAYRNSTMCWITSSSRTVHTLNLVYFGGIILFNMTVLIMVVQRLKKLRANPQQQGKTSCKDTVTVLGLTCLLGVAWAPALVSFGVLTIPQILLFTILNSVQGVFICVWYCVKGCKSLESPVRWSFSGTSQ